jgi:hypothetical protein
MHGNVELVRAHLSGLQQLQALGVQFDSYPYSSIAPIIQSVRPTPLSTAINTDVPAQSISRVQ